MKGRYIGESICLVDDLLKYAKEENSDGILFAADIEKAFASVDHNFIFSTLNKFGFGSEFIQWIKTLFKNSQSYVMKNRNSTGYFNLERGTRQGNPLSPYLFILPLDIFFVQVRGDSSIKDFRIKQFGIKLTAYANDTTLL